MRIIATLLLGAFVMTAGIFSADESFAKDKAKKNISKGQVERQKSGVKAIPPGQVKKYTRGNALPSDLKFDVIGDLDKWNLKPLNKGEKYIKVDNEVLKVNDAMEVMDTVGDVSKLLK